MSLTDIEELRLKAIESKLNTFQQAIRNLASKEELKQLLLVKETVEVILREIVDETVSLSDLTDTNLAGLQDNQVLEYDSTQLKWLPVSLPDRNLGDLLDVTLTNVIDQSFITYDNASNEWIDVSLMTLDSVTGTITMLPVDPGVVKVETGYMDRSELDDDTLITKSYVDEKFALFLPSPPPDFPDNQNLIITTSSEGNTPRLCSPRNSIAAPDRTNGGTIPAVAGGSVHRIESGHAVNTNTITSVGPGDQGTLTAYANTEDTGSVTFTTGNETGTYTNLVVSSNVDYPTTTPGFFQSFNCTISNWSADPAGPGWNRLSISHSSTSATNDVYFLEDDMTNSPIFTNLSTATITENSPGTSKTITGVPHYDTGAIVEFSGVGVQYIANETYYGGTNPLTVQTTAKVTTLNSNKKNYTDIGLPAIPERLTTSTTLSNILGTIDSNSGHGEYYLQVKFINVHGSATGNLTSTKLLLASGTNEIDETFGIPVSGLGSDPNSNKAIRIADTAGDTPVVVHTNLYNHAVFPPAEAAINAGGKLGWNTTNYSSGYLPVGPDLSSPGRDANQYATYRFQRRPVSKFDIEFTGTVEGVWVLLPGVTTSNENGWIDMTQPYLGTGNPGENGSNGCALAGIVAKGTSGYQRRTCTFGGLSSNSVTDNYILVRLKFVSGQELTQLAFKEATN